MKVIRSEPGKYPVDYIECGNCRGTGLDGFGIRRASFPCEACDGRGSHKIDPNAKTMSFSEAIKSSKDET